jgi:hypothetical protein
MLVRGGHMSRGKQCLIASDWGLSERYCVHTISAEAQRQHSGTSIENY